MENNDCANLGFEEKLFKAADKIRKNMDASEYKHIVLGLIVLKFVSDAFQQRRNALEKEIRDPSSGFSDNEDAIQRTLEDRDEYAGESIFWAPAESRWEALRATATQPDIGKRIDDALYWLEIENPRLKGIFSRNYARPSLESRTLTELINLFSSIDFMGGRRSESESEQDVVGRVYEYCLKSFATAEGKRGRQFYTPPVVVRIFVEMLEPYEGRVFDPCCGSGGNVRAEPEIHSGASAEAAGAFQHQRHQRLRAGKQRDNVAPLRNEPCRAWHRGRYCLEPRRFFSARRAHRPSRRFCDCESSLQ